MNSPLSRRRFVHAAGTGTVLSIAGCNAFQDQDPEDEAGDGEGGDDVEVPESGIAVAADVADEELAALEQEINEQVEEGEISQEEAQMEYQERQGELLADATADLEERFAEEESEIEVEESEPEAGVLLVEGEAEALIDSLDDDRVAALLPPETFAEIRQQQQQQPQGGEEGQGGEQGEQDEEDEQDEGDEQDEQEESA